MIRILQIVSTMDRGGAETFLMNVYRNIDRSSIQFDFLCHNRIEAAYTEEIRELGGKLFVVDGISHVGYSGYRRQLYTFFRQHPEYRVVHAHQNDLNGPILTQAMKANVPSRYSHSHAEYTGKGLAYHARIWYFKWLINRSATRAFACSKPAGEQLYMGVHQKTYQVVNNGINTDSFRFDPEIRQKIRVDLDLGNGPVVGHVGRFSTVKNHSFILECFRELLRLQPDAKLVLIGTGELEKAMKEKAADLEILDSTLFLGSRSDVNSLMQAMDLFIFPSISEGLPVSVVEAQASGLPVLTSDAISDDTVLTDLVQRLPLSEPPMIWAERIQQSIMSVHETERAAYADQIVLKGFDAKNVADSLCKQYLEDYYSMN